MKLTHILSNNKVNEGVLNDAQEPKYKVGDKVEFGVGVPRPKSVQQGTVTAVGPTTITVKTDAGEESTLDFRMKSLYVKPIVSQVSNQRSGAAGTPDLPRATMSRGQNKTTGLALIQYNGESYTPPESPYTKSPEGVTGTRVLVPAAAFGIRSSGDVVALLTNDGTAYTEQPLKVFNPFGQPAVAPIARPAQGLDEADEWEEDTEKHRRFIEYAKKTLMRERDPKRRIETANYLSKQENKFFGSPISSAEEQTPFGSVSTGKAFTDLIKGIMTDIQSGNLHYQQQALNAAIWLEPEGKKFLKTAHDDFINMMDHSRKEREQHAIALSGYQIANLGGRVVGSLKGGIVNDPTASMTPEILGVYEMAEQEILRKKGEREDEAERQRNIAMWNALPMPLKLAAAAAVGKTPAQLEKILFAKDEIEAVGGLDASDFPNLPQQAAANDLEQPAGAEQPATKTKPVAEGVAESVPMRDAVKVLRHYGADRFKTTSNELHFYKNGQQFSVDLILNPDATRDVTLSSLNSATRGLKGQGVAEGEQRMSRAAKGNEKYGKDGMKALAKAGREGASEKKLDTIRDKHDKYDDKVDEAAKHGLYYNMNKRKAAGTSRPASSPKAPTAQAWKDAAKTAKKESVSEGIDDRGFFNNVEQWHEAKSDIEHDDQWETSKYIVVKNNGKTVAKWSKADNYGWVDSSEQQVAEVNEDIAVSNAERERAIHHFMAAQELAEARRMVPKKTAKPQPIITEAAQPVTVPKAVVPEFLNSLLKSAGLKQK